MIINKYFEFFIYKKFIYLGLDINIVRDELINFKYILYKNNGKL